MVKKSGGEAFVFGHETSEDPFNSRFNLGVVQQEIAVEPVFTVEEVLYYIGGMYGVSKADRKIRIPKILDALSLTEKKDTKANRLSGGMKRRLMVAKALVHQPKVLILDEPTAGVDVELRRRLWEYVREINKQGTTIIFTTHYLEEAEALCENIAIINQGKIIANDSLQNLQNFFGESMIEFSIKDGNETIKRLKETFQNERLEYDETTKKFILYTTQAKVSEHLKTIANFDVAEMNILRSNLEDIFMKLIKK